MQQVSSQELYLRTTVREETFASALRPNRSPFLFRGSRSYLVGEVGRESIDSVYLNSVAAERDRAARDLKSRQSFEMRQASWSLEVARRGGVELDATLGVNRYLSTTSRRS